MTALSDAYNILKSGTLWSSTGRCKGFAVANPGEAAKIDSYIASLSVGESAIPPTLTTATGKGLVGMLSALAPSSPVVSFSGGVGLYQLGGSLLGCSHLFDGIYSTVIGDWEDADLLSRVSGLGFVYTVVAGTPGADPNFYTVLDPKNPQAYINSVLAHQAKYGFKGVFLDNCLSTIPGILFALSAVHAGIKDKLTFAANIGSYVSGNSGSDTGALWIQWAQQCSPYVDYGMLENWQQISDNGTVYAGKLRKRGAEWYNRFDDWQNCPGASLGSMKFMPVTYGPPAPGATTAGRLYGRAAMLTAPNVKSDAVFVYSTPQADPYGDWTTPTPHPVIDPVAGTASL